MGANGQPMTKEEKQQMEYMFKVFDKSNDGLIQLSEFKDGLIK